MALGLFERAEDQTFVPTKQLRGVEIERALRLLRQGTAGYCDYLAGTAKAAIQRNWRQQRLCLFRGAARPAIGGQVAHPR
jgi:hypothetical protein